MVVQEDGPYFVRYMAYGGSKGSSTTATALAYGTAVQQRHLRAKWLLWSPRLFALVSSFGHYDYNQLYFTPCSSLVPVLKPSGRTRPWGLLSL
jgi:hypothetical protein